jgi:ABC-type branched-subunit amino acid transport system substrate-binding protein
MTRLRLPLALMAATACAVPLGACGSDSSSDDDSASSSGGSSVDLVIGSLLPLTGESSQWGAPWRKASDIAAAQIQRAIDEAGVDHSLTLLQEDSQALPQDALQAARQVVAQDATCISGPASSSSAIPVANSLALRDGIMMVTTATSDQITTLDDPDGLVNRSDPPDSFQGPTLATVIAEAIGGADGKTVNIGARNDPYGTGLADTFAAAWEASGGTIGERVIYDPRQPGYDSEAAQIVKGDPDAFVIIDFPETYSKVGPALVRTGKFDPRKAFTTDGLYSLTLGRDAGDAAVNGMRGTTPGAPQDSTASTGFQELYARSAPSNVELEAFSAQVFDNIMLCYLAAVAAGSSDGTEMAAKVRDVSAAPGEKFSWQQLPQAIRALENGEEIDYEGASGEIEMNDAGDATAGVYDVFEFQQGAPRTTSQVPVADQAG